jgi:hypothetical protein
MRFLFFNLLPFTCFGPIDHLQKDMNTIETTITLCFVNIDIYIQCHHNKMYKSNVLTSTGACTNTLKYLLHLVCLKKIFFVKTFKPN